MKLHLLSLGICHWTKSFNNGKINQTEYRNRTYANLYPATKLIVQNPRMRNELRYYEPKVK